MTYDGFVLSATITELNHTLIRGRIQKIRQHNDTDLTLEIRGLGHTYKLFFSVDARFPRVYLSAGSPPVPQEPPAFCMVLRKYIEGAFIEGLEQVGMDRIMRMHIAYPDATRLTLIFELMGKHSNLILVNSEGKILGAAKHIGTSVSRYRQILPGRDYLPPPGVEKIDPRQIDEASFDNFWNATLPEVADVESAKKWLMNTFSGISPFLADEILQRTSEEGKVDRESIRDEIIGVGEMARTGQYEPVFVTNERGQGLLVYPMPLVQYPTDQQHPRASINESLDALFRTLVGHSLLEDERTQTLTAIRRSEAARKQVLKSIERTIAESEKADRYREIGELIFASLGTIEKGAKKVNLINYYDPEMPEIQVELDEKLTPQQNAERYFKRYQKARDAVDTATARKNETLRQLSILESAREEVESSNNAEAVKELRKSLIEQNVLRTEIAAEAHVEEFAGYRIRRTFTPEGWEILYGENSQSNDYLTQRVARPNDVWLHARQITGAHVVIRTAGKKGDVPRPVLLQAAKIAAQNSEAKHSSLVPIDYTQRKYVRKPRGSAPGFVIYRNEKTIDMDPKA